MLASEMTIEAKRLEKASKVISSRFLIWLLTSQEHRWKENQSGKESLSWFPRENFWLNREKEGRNLLFLFSMSINRLFRWSLYLRVRYLMDKLCGIWYVQLIYQGWELIL